MTRQEVEALKAERDALIAMINSLEVAYLEWLSSDDYNVLVLAFEKTPKQCLNDVLAEAGRKGYLDGALNFDPDYDPCWAADQYAAAIRHGEK